MERDECGCRKDTGHVHPRIFTKPARELTKETSRGFQAIWFATEVLGLRLLPWQKWFLIHALELNPDGTPRFRTIILLVSRQNGKTTVAVVWLLCRLFLWKDLQSVILAQDMVTAEATWESVTEVVKSNKYLRRWFKKQHTQVGHKHLELTDRRSLRPLAGNRRGSGRGGSPQSAFLDELREFYDFQMWSSVSKSILAQDHGQILTASNAGTARSMLLKQLREAAKARAELEEYYEYGDPATQTGLFEYSAHPDRELGELEGLREANPALGYTLKLTSLLSALETDTPGEFRTECMCQWVLSMDAPLDVETWTRSGDPNFTLAEAARRGEIKLTLEVSPDYTSVALAAAVLNSETGMLRTQVLKTWQGPRSTALASAEVPAIIKKLKATSIAWFPEGGGSAIAPFMAKLRGVKVIEIRGAQVAAVCGYLAAAVVSKKVTHPGQEEFLKQLIASKRLKVADGWRFSRTGDIPCTMLYATAGAVFLAAIGPENMSTGYIPAPTEKGADNG